MLTLNLINMELGNLKYEITKFPDGQQMLSLIDLYIPPIGIRNKDIMIVISIRNFGDVELLLCAVSALRNSNFNDLHLEVHYMMGARSDRAFEEAQPHYMRDVMAPILNAQNFMTISILDAHSDVCEAVFPKYRPLSNHLFIKKSLEQIDNKNDARERIVLVSPDAGALKKLNKHAKDFKIPEMIIASKNRNTLTGEITHTSVTGLGRYTNKAKFVIIDDICDGGRTFTEIAKIIKGEHPDAEIYLIVTHGIFSQGLKPFKGLFTRIFMTDSYRDITNINDEFVIHNERNIDLLRQINLNA